MSNNEQINPACSRRAVQDQSSPGSTQRCQNIVPTQQRVWDSCPDDHRLETAGTPGHGHSVRNRSSKTHSYGRTTRADRSATVSTNRPAESGKRLAQKKITHQSTLDRRRLIDPADQAVSINRQCVLLGLSRSSYYYEPVGESAQNLALMERIDKLFTARPEMGVRRMYHELKTRDNPVNIKRIRRLMRLMGLEAVGPKPNLSKPQPGHTIYPYLLKEMVIERPNQVWSTDITYIPMRNGFLYLCAVIDWFSRFILSWRLSNTLLADFCVDALQEALTKWGKPAIFNTDQGSQFTSHDFLNPLMANNIRISMDSKGRALDNIFIERFWRTIKYEHIYLRDYGDGRSLHEGLTGYFHFYNQERKHQSLGYQTPAEWYGPPIERKVQFLPPTISSLN